jgi:hypothetical protein
VSETLFTLAYIFFYTAILIGDILL